ncbi:MAG: N-acetyltransferase [Syntrophobacterales bacterium]|jgi:amino-acid N-acetyltransferase|nr:N-acetyltransferase [Syntrophobacterales bacterium]
MIRKARIQEVPEIRRFLVEYSQDGGLLPRTLADLYGQLRDYYVYREDAGPIQGIAALHICWAGLGEIRSVAVTPALRGRGIGSRLVKTCLAEARVMGLSEIFLLTLRPEFFQHFGFKVVSREDLLPIVWADCVNCVKFPDCDEIPMLLDLTAPGQGGVP